MALAVVVHHLSIVDAIGEWTLFKNYFWRVPFFFTLSGFIIAYVYDKPSFNAKNFMIARVFKILPLYYIFLFAFIILECLKFVLYHQIGVFNNPPFSGENGVDQILPSIFLLQSWLPWTHPASFNGPAWSLSVEWYIYIGFLLLMFVPKLVRYCVVAVCVICAYVVFLTVSTSPGVRGILYFGSGMLVCLLFSMIKSKLDKMKLDKIRFPVLLTLLEMLTLSAFFYIIIFSLTEYLVFVLAALIFVFALSSYAKANFDEGGAITSILENRTLLFFGSLSYCIYISHTLVVIFLNIPLRFLTRFDILETKYVDEIFYIDFHSPILANLYLLLNLCVVVFVAYLLHKYIEKPCVAFGKKLRNKPISS